MSVETIGLPQGVALLRIETPTRRVTLVSDRLSQSQEQAARVFASALGVDGARYILILTTELLGLIHDAAA